MRNLIKNLDTLEKKIEKIIGTSNDYRICNCLEDKWSMTDDNKYFNFDRYGDDMWEYGQYQVSSLGTKQEKLFMGEEEGIFFIMGYEEDGGWDDAELFVFDVKNRIDWNPEDN